MKIDTPEKYKALQERRRKTVKVRQSDGMLKDRKGRKQTFEIATYSKPKHHERALVNGFVGLMTRAVVPKGWFEQLTKKASKSA